MTNIKWKINRLRRMENGEILFRIINAFKGKAESYGIGLAKDSQPSSVFGNFWAIDTHQIDEEKYTKAADRILSGKFNIFALSNAEVGFPPNWNKDPFTGKLAPMSFGKSINYRDESLVGNIKYLWEPNRHLELVTLAQAYKLTGEIKYAYACKSLLESWFNSCPYPSGCNWASSLENAIRLVNWALAWHLLGSEDSCLFVEDVKGVFKSKWLKSIYQHCYFINGHFSRFSSANNHLLGEYMGLFIASTTWCCWKESSHWQECARNGLEHEVAKQNSSDGCNREQGLWYHHEVADMLLLCGLVGKNNNIKFSETYWDRLEAMLEFICSLGNAQGVWPMIGDSDDAVMIRFVPDNDFPVFKSLLATGAVIFERTDFALKVADFDDKSRWLLGSEGEAKFQYLLAVDRGKELEFKRSFPEGGYYILGKDFDTSKEVKAIVDAGPLGYTSIAAHGHADALSMLLSLGGEEVLVDPGTYAYHTERKWRDYFKGTSAHNTVRIDRQDQSVSGGNFMWTKHANAWCDDFGVSDTRDVFRGSHDGYVRFEDPVMHTRIVELDKKVNQIIVTDEINCSKEHHIELFWHVAESCSVKVDGDVVIVTGRGPCLEISMPKAGLLPEICHGNEDVPLGWISRKFDFKTPSTAIKWAGDVSCSTTFKTVLKYQFFKGDKE